MPADLQATFAALPEPDLITMLVTILPQLSHKALCQVISEAERELHSRTRESS